MKSIFLSAPLMVLGVAALGVGAAAHFGPIGIPGSLIAFEIEVPVTLWILLGAALMAIGIAVEVRPRNKS